MKHRLRGRVLLLCAALALAGCAEETLPPPAPPLASTAKVITRSVADWEEFTGKMHAVESVEIRPRASGYIDAVLFAEGQLVRRNEVLFIIDPRRSRAMRARR